MEELKKNELIRSTSLSLEFALLIVYARLAGVVELQLREQAILIVHFFFFYLMSVVIVSVQKHCAQIKEQQSSRPEYCFYYLVFLYWSLMSS